MTTADAATSIGAAGTGQERKAPGRPRNAQADAVILDAVLDMLSGGLSTAAISIEAVAAKAGVGKATIYRRWPNKEALIIDAVRRMKGPLPEPKGESVRDDLIMILKVNRSRSLQRYGLVSACLIPDMLRDHELRRMYQTVIEPRRDVTRGVLRRGIASGELRADLDIEMAVLMLSAPSMMQTMMTDGATSADDGFAEKLVDAVLRGAHA